MSLNNETIQCYSNARALQAYDRECENFWRKFPRRIIQNFTASMGRQKLVLDIGSGSGRGSILLEVFGNKVICLDGSNVMAAHTLRYHGLTSVQGDFTRLPFVDSIFNGVFASRSLFNIPKANLPGSLDEISRVLTSHGSFGIVMLEPSRNRQRANQSRFAGGLRHIERYTPEEMEAILANHNFDILDFAQIRTARSKYFAFVARKV